MVFVTTLIESIRFQQANFKASVNKATQIPEPNKKRA